MTSPEAYRVYCVRYALMDGTRSRRELFPGLDPSEEGPASVAYYVWAMVNEQRTIVVDAGMSAADASSRGRPYDYSPAEGLATIGIDAKTVDHLILTHLHWDHAGTQADFPNAMLHVQETEIMQTVNAEKMLPYLRQEYDPEHLAVFIRTLYAGRAVLHKGVSEVASGITLYPLPGHTPGQQVVRVWTERGWMVVASDAVHMYEQIERCIPFRVVTSVPEMLQGYGKMLALAERPEYILAGHDPLVMDRFPAARPGLERMVMRCDVPL